MNKTLTSAKTKKKPAAKNTKHPKKSAAKKVTKPYGLLVKKDGSLETKEERKKRLSRLDALTLRAFQMAYNNYNSR